MTTTTATAELELELAALHLVRLIRDAGAGNVPGPHRDALERLEAALLAVAEVHNHRTATTTAVLGTPMARQGGPSHHVTAGAPCPSHPRGGPHEAADLKSSTAERCRWCGGPIVPPATELAELAPLELAELLVGRELTEPEAIVAGALAAIVAAAEGGPACPLLTALEAAGYRVTPAAELTELEGAGAAMVSVGAWPAEWHQLLDARARLTDALEAHQAAARAPRRHT